MAMLTVRNLPEEVHRALRVRAAQHGHGTEAEVRETREVSSWPLATLLLMKRPVYPSSTRGKFNAFRGYGRRIRRTDEEHQEWCLGWGA